MSGRFVLSAPAAADLDGILSYVLEEGGPERARQVADGLERAFHKLAESSGLGHKREDLTALPVRFLAVWSYLIIYQPDTKPLEIVRVLHGARDVVAILGDIE